MTSVTKVLRNIDFCIILTDNDPCYLKNIEIQRSQCSFTILREDLRNREEAAWLVS